MSKFSSNRAEESSEDEPEPCYVSTQQHPAPLCWALLCCPAGLQENHPLAPAVQKVPADITWHVTSLSRRNEKQGCHKTAERLPRPRGALCSQQALESLGHGGGGSKVGRQVRGACWAVLVLVDRFDTASQSCIQSSSRPALREALQGHCRGRALSHHLSRALQQLLSSSLHSALQALDRHVIVVVIRAELGEQP